MQRARWAAPLLFGSVALVYGGLYSLVTQGSLYGWPGFQEVACLSTTLVSFWLGPHLATDTLSWWPARAWGGPKSGMLVTLFGFVLGALVCAGLPSGHDLWYTGWFEGEVPIWHRHVGIGARIQEVLTVWLALLFWGTVFVLVPALPFGAGAGWLFFRWCPPGSDAPPRS